MTTKHVWSLSRMSWFIQNLTFPLFNVYCECLLSFCVLLQFQDADPPRSPAFNGNTIFNPQGVSWSVYLCIYIYRDIFAIIRSITTTPWTYYISLQKAEIVKAEAHPDAQETEDFSGELNSTTASWSWSKPHSWSHLDHPTEPKVKHTHR